MKFGICTSLDNIEKVKALGFDYLEASVSTIANYSEEEFGRTLEMVQKADFPVPCFNILFPKTMALIGAEADWNGTGEYLHHAFSRVRLLGGKTVVFGSGKCRKSPAGMDFSASYKELVEVTRKTGETAAGYGLEIVIEPLNRTETNTVNSVGEGAILAADVDLPNVGLLADSYHMFRDNDPVDDIPRIGSFRHTHIASLEGRGYPLEADGRIRSFFKALSEAGYEGTMSIEGKSEDMERDATKALGIMRALSE